MERIARARRTAGSRTVRALLALGAAAALALTLGLTSASSASEDTYASLPYTPLTTLPASKDSPSVDAAAPYTPAVLSLISQLESTPTPTQAQLANADALLHDGPNSSCHNVGPVSNATGTTPTIAPICWTDAQGVLNTSGPQARGSTGPMTLMGLGSSFDRSLGNAWGQTAGTEAREFMVTGIFGPQTDLDRLPNWGRNLTTTGEDPFLSGQMVASQIKGMQGSGAMSQMKHFVVYNGQNQNANTDIQDQGLHELYATPYEGGFVDGRAAATMCSYQIWRDTSTNPLLANPVSALTSGPSPYAAAGENPLTWPLNESHFSCEQPLSLNYILRDLWGSKAFVGSDYPATHSTSAITNGMDQEMPTSNGFLSANHTLSAGQQTDATGSTCADASGNYEPCSTPGAVHVGGLPNHFQGSAGTGCPTYGCPVVDAVVNGVLPLSVFNQSLARILYQEERFKLLGCDNTTAGCSNPGGVGGDRTGTAQLPDGSTGQIGTKNGDAALVEKYSEEGATLLKNDGHALPLTSSDLSGGVFVTGANANHTVADPTSEASTGFIGRDAVNPLQQLKDLSGQPGAFSYYPANDPTGAPISVSQLSTTPDSSGLGGLNLSVDGGAPTKDTNPVDHSAVNGNQLAPGHTYTWSGYLYVPTSDTYTFAIQQSPTLPTTLNCPQTGQFGTPASNPTLTLCSPFTAANASQTNTPPDAVSFSFNGAQRNLNATTAAIYGATVPTNPTTAGYTDQGLISRTCATGTTVAEPGTTNCTATESSLTGGTFYPISVTVNNATNCVSTPPAAAAGANPAVPAVLAPCTAASFRLAVSRATGDIADAAAKAAGKSKAIVFVNDGVGATSTTANPDGTATTISAPTQLSAASVNLINAVAAANPNTIVVADTANPVLTPWIGSAKSLLEMWFASQEGGTSTARILLGQANPSGHTSLTWPANATDTIWAYNETTPLYPGDTTGRHPERLNGNGGCSPAASCTIAAGQTTETEGIYAGYRFFDKEGITPQFPFGYGLSYSTFAFNTGYGLNVVPATDGGLDVSFKIRNSGSVPGADAVQLYVGAPASAPAGVQFAVRSLAQFDRIQLSPSGDWTKETFHVAPRALSYWSESAQRWVRVTGPRTIYVGDADSTANLPLSTSVSVAATPSTKCSNESINATQIAGDVKVPPGAWCDLVAVTVNGDVTVQSGSTGLRVLNSTITGTLDSEDAASAADPQSSGADVICNSTIQGTLEVKGSDASVPWNIGGCGGNTIGHDLTFRNNNAPSTVSNNAVAGNLKCAGNATPLTHTGNTWGTRNPASQQC